MKMLVPMTKVNLQFITGVNETGDKFTAGVNNIVNKCMTGFTVTGDKT